MKKAISILLAVATLAFSTSALADKGATVNTSRNKSANAALPIEPSSMPCFRVGDTITITATGLADVDDLTVISYKDAVSPTLSDSTIQYINQYNLDATTKLIRYKIRNIETGIYHLDIIDDAGKVSFYYTIGKVDADILPNPSRNPGDNVQAYEAYQPDGDKWSVGFVAKISIDYYDGGNISDLAILPGIRLSDTTDSKLSQMAAAITSSDAYEVGGEATYLYGVTVYNVTNGAQDDITAEAVTE